MTFMSVENEPCHPLEDLVKEALSSYEPDVAATVSVSTLPCPDVGGSIPEADAGLLVIGIGTAGTRIVERLLRLARPGLRTLAIDSNRESLEHSSATSRFQLKHSYFSGGFGLCGGDPDHVDRYTEATQKAMTDIEPLLGNPEFCFIIAGMGGNMGTGAAPVVARMLRERGAVVIAIVTRPFLYERQRKIRAELGIRKLIEVAHTVLILEFEKLSSVLPAAMVLPQYYSVMDHIIALAIHNIWESTYCTSFENYERKDLHYILERGKIGTLLIGEFDRNDKDDRRSLNERVIQVPLMDFPVREVKGCILHITAGNDIDFFDTGQITDILCMSFDPHSDIIWATTIRKEMDGRVRMFSIVTGLSDESRVPDISLDRGLAEP
jgi:cell division protein FtsZ